MKWLFDILAAAWNARPRPNWKKFWGHMWNEGTIALLMAATSYPIADWQYKNFKTQFGPGFDLFFSILSGLALDMMIVKVATGPRTHPTLLKSWNFWAPAMAYLASCFILYDKYNAGIWTVEGFKIGSIVHLWYPTATFATAMYMSRIQTHEADISTPLQARIAELLDQIKRDAASFAERLATETKGLSDQINSYIRDLSEALNRETSLKSQIAQLTDQLTANQSRLDGRTGVEVELNNQINSLTRAHEHEVDRLRKELTGKAAVEAELMGRVNGLLVQVNQLMAANQAASTNQRDLNSRIDELQQELIEASTSNQLPVNPELRVVQPTGAMKDSFRQLINENPEISNDELFTQLGISKSDPRISSYRSMISDLRKAARAA